MNTGNIILAMALITAPSEMEDAPAPDQWDNVAAAVQDVAIKWEIMDPREKNYMMARRESYVHDIHSLRVRYKELKNAPLSCDCYRLPPKEFAHKMVEFNRRYRRHLEERRELELDRAAIIGTAIQETEDLHEVWDAVRDAQYDYCYVVQRRKALLKLKQLLGEEDYMSMTLPPNVPHWRFNTMK